MGHQLLKYFTACLLICCVAWIHPHQKQEIEDAMNQYNRYILSMNTDSIASIFAPDGDLGNIAHGRDSIRHFLNRFKDYQVLSQTSTTDSMSIRGDSAFQRGMYWQTTILPSKDTIHVKGIFTGYWVWLDPAGWKIKRMETQPLR